MGWNKLRVNFVFQKLWQQDDEGNGARVRRSDSTSRLGLAAETVQLPPPSSFGRKRLQLWNWLDSLDLWSSHFKVGQRPRIVTRCSLYTQLNTDTPPFKPRTYRSISACLRHWKSLFLFSSFTQRLFHCIHVTVLFNNHVTVLFHNHVTVLFS